MQTTQPLSFLLFENLSHHCRSVLEADLVSSPHLSSGSIAHAVEYLVKHINLLLTQRIFKGYAELVKLVRELGGVNITHTEVVNHINHCKHPFGIYLACCTCLTMFVWKLLYAYCRKSQGMKQLMSGLGLILLAIVLVPVLETMMTGAI